MSDGSPPPSICFIRAAESYPKSQMEKEDSQLFVPFQELAGESIKYLGRTDDGVLALSNYRIFLSKKSTSSETYVPLGLIESVQVRDLFQLIVNCKDASTVRCSFPSAEQCSEWQRRIQLLIGVPETLETLFAFPFYSWTCDTAGTGGNKERNINSLTCQKYPNTNSESLPNYLNDYNRLKRTYKTRYEIDFKNEVARLGFDLKGSWRISTANADFKLCPSYPQNLLVPFCITDEMLHNVANFRGSRRLPAVVWRHQKSGAVLARCSQPEVGWLGWRNCRDEQLLKALADACAFDRGEDARRSSQQMKDTSGQTSLSGKSSPSLEDSSHEELALDEIRKILIVDARSYTSAVTNRARGGGCECIEYYPCAEIEFMNLGNIHAIRKSFHALRQLCASPPEDPNWHGPLDKTMWMQHLSGLLGASMTVVHTIENKGRPVLVHCSDGWDRTPQIVATAQICLDPYYRTVEGFRVLVEREWLSFGHKFADRSGNGPNSDEVNERCPVFLQWLDLVHQIHEQFSCYFEFSIGYLIKLAQHSLSCLFGTFLCNSLRERIENSVFDRTFSVWPFLAETMYKNPLYNHDNETVLWPAHNVRFLHFWSDVYLGSLGNKNGTDLPATSTERQSDNIGTMTKTRSSGNLIANELGQNNLSRRSSDPNLAVESSVNDYLNLNSNSMFDIRSDSNDCGSHVNNNIRENLENSLKSEYTKNLKQDDSGSISSSPELNAELEAASKCAHFLDINPEHTLSNDITNIKLSCDPQNEIPDKVESTDYGPIDTSTDTLISSESDQHNVSKNSSSENQINVKHLDNHTDPCPEKISESISVGLAHTNKISESCSNMAKVHIKRSAQRYLQKVNGSSTESDYPLDSADNIGRQTNGNLENCNEHKNDPRNLTTDGHEFISSENQQQTDMPNRLNSNVQCIDSLPFELTTTNKVRRNTLSSNSSHENAHPKYAENGSALHFNATGINSLPQTPQGSQERTQFAISCPDGLAHALSEQNIRLHQIVQEHKMREDVLLREIHGMRLALLHKACPSCNSVVSTNVDHENGLDVIEIASTCSWEALEERSGPSSYNTIQEKKTPSVLWVPDHAVSRCSNCQIEFWLGRRKHHCRSCGEIFCADCSEFWAPLPYEKLFNPVRLCGSCYTAVTTHLQECHFPSDGFLTNENAKPHPNVPE